MSHLKTKANDILHDNIKSRTSQFDDDNIIQAKMVGSKVRYELNVMEKSLDLYPNPVDINIDKLEPRIVDRLQT